MRNLDPLEGRCCTYQAHHLTPELKWPSTCRKSHPVRGGKRSLPASVAVKCVPRASRDRKSGRDAWRHRVMSLLLGRTRGYTGFDLQGGEVICPLQRIRW